MPRLPPAAEAGMPFLYGLSRCFFSRSGRFRNGEGLLVSSDQSFFFLSLGGEFFFSEN